MTGFPHDESRIEWARRGFEAADRHFLSETARSSSASELACTRIGLIGSFAIGSSGLAFLPWQRFHWPLPVLLAISASALLFIALPFLLRQRPAIRLLGDFVCAEVTACAFVVVAISGGRATGILPVLAMIPMLALQMRGGGVHLHDVTDLVRARTNYQTLVDQSLQGIAVARGFRIVYANPALAALFEVLVEDDGPGVPLVDRDRILDPFYTTRLKAGGTGLGLSVAHAIVTDHGGRMELVTSGSRAEKGACFRVTLPVEKSERGVPAGPVD